MRQVLVYLVLSCAVFLSTSLLSQDSCEEASIAFQDRFVGYSPKLFDSVADESSVPVLPGATPAAKQVHVAIVTNRKGRSAPSARDEYCDTSGPGNGNCGWVQGWSLSLAVEENGARLVDAFVDRTRNPMRDFLNGGFEKTEIVDPTRIVDGMPQGLGVVCALIPGVYAKYLHSKGTTTVLSLSFEADPAQKSVSAKVFCKDGLVGSGQPVSNKVTVESRQQSFCECREVTVSFHRTEPGPFSRCNANSDGLFDISDPIFVLRWLFHGLDAPSCLAAVDCNADSRLDLSDAVYALRHLFLGGTPPPSPFPECGQARSDEGCLPGTESCL